MNCCGTPHKPVKNIPPSSRKYRNSPLFPQNLEMFPLFSFNLRFLLNLHFLCYHPPYFDHNAFVHHTLHVLNAPAFEKLSHSRSYLCHRNKIVSNKFALFLGSRRISNRSKFSCRDQQSRMCDVAEVAAQGTTGWPIIEEQ